MNVEALFERKTPSLEKMITYGFKGAASQMTFQRTIADGQFTLHVTVTGKEVKAELFDEFGEPYVLHLVDEATGEFVGRVREEFFAALEDVAKNCFEECVFQSETTQLLIALARERYGVAPEYLWEKFPDNAVFRRSDNGKWFGAILTVERKKLGVKGSGTVEVLDVRAEPEELPLLLDGEKIFGGWHMNKKHWISLLLDGTLAFAEIAERLEESYFIAGKRQ